MHGGGISQIEIGSRTELAQALAILFQSEGVIVAEIFD